MTTNQIAYAKVREDSRHNLETEGIERGKAQSAAIQAQASASQAATAAQRLQEDIRHNKEGERVNWFTTYQTLGETKRHNVRLEELQDRDVTARELYQRDMAQIGRWNATSQERQAAVSEMDARTRQQQLEVNWFDAESRRKQASAAQAQAAAAAHQARVAELNADTRRSELAESIRHSQAMETETHRANTQKELAELRSANTRDEELSHKKEELEETRRLNDIRQIEAEASKVRAEAAKQQAEAMESRAIFGGTSDLARSLSSVATIYGMIG